MQCAGSFAVHAVHYSDLQTIPESTLVGYADESTMLVEVPEPGSRVKAVLSLNRDIACIGD